MKKRFIFLIFLLLIQSLILVGCLRSTTATSPSQTKVIFQQIIPTSTSTPLQNKTSTIIPTLSSQEARERMLGLLKNNGGCLLPCFWGISLNESTYSEAEDILEPLSSISSYKDLYPSPGAIDLVLSGDKIDVRSRLRYVYDENGVINHIAFRIEARQDTPDGGYENVFGLPVFGEYVSYYELPNILATYGKPESVWVGTLAGDFPNGGSWGFHILLLYPEQGLLIDYTTEMQLRDDQIIGCPSNASIELELYPSGNGELFFDLLEPTNWSQNIISNYRPIENVTSLTVEEFYRLFLEPGDRCIETPSEFWPIPE